jgi:hypothetical protein
MQRAQESFTFPIMQGATGPANALFAGDNQYPFFVTARVF